ncbi:dioxygenase [Shimazuella sp. AN120528]|uniref:DODA-type extradiol aromatic ring-opening family dioxygenase n=1 Tax=Shimazuella soli TaxID=1892854 RepID=UPI001F0FB131|nr:dioxygenase [Shimazuella soli]MCH5586221.1 dioxygenase [Shimazuella soli]
MSSLFLSHGSPLIAIREDSYTKFLHKLGQELKRPKAIVLFTAHWESEVLTLSCHDETYKMIYDFGGFPDEMYQITYPAKGSTEVVKLTQQLLSNKGITTKLDTDRGLDHGSWTLLKHLYPDATIPVVQASVNPFLPAEEQYQIGEALRGLAKHDILLIGSGSTVHNLHILNWDQKEPEQWAIQFDQWLIDQITTQNKEALFHYASQAPHAERAVPRPEHFVPFLITAGACSSEASVLFQGYELGSLSYLCVGFDLNL